MCVVSIMCNDTFYNSNSKLPWRCTSSWTISRTKADSSGPQYHQVTRSSKVCLQTCGVSRGSCAEAGRYVVCVCTSLNCCCCCCCCVSANSTRSSTSKNLSLMIGSCLYCVSVSVSSMWRDSRSEASTAACSGITHDCSVLTCQSC